MGSKNLMFANEVYKIQGAVFEVYKEIGCGFLESVYQECLENEFKIQNIPFYPQQELKIFYKGNKLKQTYKPDFICFNKIIIEIKAISEIANIHKAQVINYLKASDNKLGLLINFGSYPKVDIHRLIHTL